jgi:spore coat polysaccharide biosynthesis predicted glycosyltransferase SpsG
MTATLPLDDFRGLRRQLSMTSGVRLQAGDSVPGENCCHSSIRSRRLANRADKDDRLARLVDGACVSGEPSVIFRCDVSPKIGIGHLMRSRTFAAELRRAGQRCVMVGPSVDYRSDVDAALFDAWIPVPEWESGESDAETFVSLARAHGARRAVIDDYRADETFQEVLRDAGLVWMQHFDSSKPYRFWADMIVHGSPSETAERWRPCLLNPETEMLFGPAYAVLRSEFPPPHLRPNGRAVDRVLVSFGGGNDQGAVLLTLEALLGRTADTVRLAVMSGSRNPNNQAIQAWIDRNAGNRVTLHVEPKDIAGLFASCDLAVLGGGISIYEAASCGLPMLVMALADNQLRQCDAWEKLGAAVFLGPRAEVTTGLLADRALELIADRERRASMSAAGRDAVDGRGASRLAEHLLRERRK